jgi:hypothetical protein
VWVTRPGGVVGPHDALGIARGKRVPAWLVEKAVGGMGTLFSTRRAWAATGQTVRVIRKGEKEGAFAG